MRLPNLPIMKKTRSSSALRSLVPTRVGAEVLRKEAGAVGMAATIAGDRLTSPGVPTRVWFKLSRRRREWRRSPFLSQPRSTCLRTPVSGEGVVVLAAELRAPATGI